MNTTSRTSVASCASVAMRWLRSARGLCFLLVGALALGSATCARGSHRLQCRVPRRIPAAVPSRYTNVLGMTFVRIPRGYFVMGSPAHEFGRVESVAPGSSCSEDQSRVGPVGGVLIQTAEVTNAQYKRFRPSHRSRQVGSRGLATGECNLDEDSSPVVSVSWRDAQAFAEWLTSRDSRVRYRLPTEAEWEYACRAGSTSAYAFGNTLNADQANFGVFGAVRRGATQCTKPVGSYRANRWKIHDMHGNVWEWCADKVVVGPECGGDDWNSSQTEHCIWRPTRGGSYFEGAVDDPVRPEYCRCAHRDACPEDERLEDIGFRLVAVFRSE